MAPPLWERFVRLGTSGLVRLADPDPPAAGRGPGRQPVRRKRAAGALVSSRSITATVPAGYFGDVAAPAAKAALLTARSAQLRAAIGRVLSGAAIPEDAKPELSRRLVAAQRALRGAERALAQFEAAVASLPLDGTGEDCPPHEPALGPREPDDTDHRKDQTPAPGGEGPLAPAALSRTLEELQRRLAGVDSAADTD